MRAVREIPASYEEEHVIVVTPEMTVDFEDRVDPRLGKVHPVYATYWLTKHMELVSLKLLLPFLEEGEAGIGHEVSVRHLSSAVPGMRVSLKATFERVEGNRVYISCRALSELGDLIGTGTTTQVVLSTAKLQANFARLNDRFREFKET